MIPNPESAGPQTSDEIPLPRHQSQELTDSVAMIQNREYPRAEKTIHDYLLTHPDAAEAHYLMGYTLYR
jgi:TolA-binding protein